MCSEGVSAPKVTRRSSRFINPLVQTPSFAVDWHWRGMSATGSVRTSRMRRVLQLGEASLPDHTSVAVRTSPSSTWCCCRVSPPLMRSMVGEKRWYSSGSQK
jgi:hypothetical protein